MTPLARSEADKLALLRGGVDAAVIDFGLPDRRGDALFREIRALYSSLPIVLATGQNVADLCSSFQGEQRVAFVSKPYTDADLLTALKSLGISHG
jgi:CheY-like chemotaxis protein